MMVERTGEDFDKWGHLSDEDIAELKRLEGRMLDAPQMTEHEEELARAAVGGGVQDDQVTAVDTVEQMRATMPVTRAKIKSDYGGVDGKQAAGIRGVQGLYWSDPTRDNDAAHVVGGNGLERAIDVGNYNNFGGRIRPLWRRWMGSANGWVDATTEEGEAAYAERRAWKIIRDGARPVAASPRDVGTATPLGTTETTDQRLERLRRELAEEEGRTPSPAIGEDTRGERGRKPDWMSDAEFATFDKRHITGALYRVNADGTATPLTDILKDRPDFRIEATNAPTDDSRKTWGFEGRGGPRDRWTGTDWVLAASNPGTVPATPPPTKPEPKPEPTADPMPKPEPEPKPKKTTAEKNALRLAKLEKWEAKQAGTEQKTDEQRAADAAYKAGLAELDLAAINAVPPTVRPGIMGWWDRRMGRIPPPTENFLKLLNKPDRSPESRAELLLAHSLGLRAANHTVTAQERGIEKGFWQKVRENFTWKGVLKTAAIAAVAPALLAMAGFAIPLGAVAGYAAAGGLGKIVHNIFDAGGWKKTAAFAQVATTILAGGAVTYGYFGSGIFDWLSNLFSGSPGAPVPPSLGDVAPALSGPPPTSPKGLSKPHPAPS